MSGTVRDVTIGGGHQAASVPVERDPLTGLFSRATLHAHLSMLQARGEHPALLALDLDRFQAVNDSTGIATGDGVLVRVAKRIASAAPPDAVIARISGDEFAVIIPNSAHGERIAAHLLELISRPFAVNGFAVTLSVSIGLALAPEHGEDADALLRAANIALHRAEREGKNRWCRFEPWMQEQAAGRQMLETDLRAALALNRVELRRTMGVQQFEVHYQPQVSAATRAVTGFEALVRWRHPNRGIVGPSEFIPLAEEIGLIGLLGDWVLGTACRAAMTWPASGDTPVTVAVNVSPLQLREGRSMIGAIANALATSGLPAHRLEIEITESALNLDALDTLIGIKALGVRLALDDFGTGYSSLSQLAQYPFDRLKIDRSFIRALVAPASGADATPSAEDLHARWMIQAISSLGGGLGLTTVAEGVETEFQAEIVRLAGVTDVQGFLYDKPMPEDAVSQWIEQHAAQAQSSQSETENHQVPNRLFSLAYFSRNAIVGTPADVQNSIAAILRTARSNNPKHNVTGALLYSDGCFAQVLEGRREDVEQIFESIQCDGRHSDVTIMHLHPVEERSFAQWSMAFAGIEGVSAQPTVAGDGMLAPDDILSSDAGQNLLAALKSVVHRDELGRIEEQRGAA